MEIAQKNGGLRTGDDKNQKDEKQKSKHIVHLAGPNRIEDKEELNEDAAERQNAAHHDARNGLGVDRLIGDLPGNLVGSHGMLKGLVHKNT